MNPGILYWGTLVLAVAAGAGIMAVIELFRSSRAAARIDPVTAAAEKIADVLGPLTRAPVTTHREFDTIDVYNEGYQAGQRQPPRVPHNNDTSGLVSGTTAAFPAGAVDPLDTRQPWITQSYPNRQ